MWENNKWYLNILTTGQEERTKIMFLLFMKKSLKSFFFLTIFVNKTYNQYGIQVKKIKHLFLSLHFVCYLVGAFLCNWPWVYINSSRDLMMTSVDTLHRRGHLINDWEDLKCFRKKKPCHAKSDSRFHWVISEWQTSM